MITSIRFWSTIVFVMISAVAAVLWTQSGQAQESEKSSNEIPFYNSWLGQDTATGDWYSLRSKLKDNGITFSSYYCTDIGGNPIGGLKKRTIYAGFLDVGVAFDFEKIASCKGLALTVGNHLASGNYLSSSVGNFLASKRYMLWEIIFSGN